MVDIIQLSFVGVIVSLFIQWLKNKMKTDKLGTLTIVAFVSLIVAIIYWFFQGTGILEAFISILGFAGATYSFIILRFKEDDIDI